VAHVPFNDTFPVIFKDLSFLYEDVIWTIKEVVTGAGVLSSSQFPLSICNYIPLSPAYDVYTLIWFNMQELAWHVINFKTVHKLIW
jgi:hypothetical protein